MRDLYKRLRADGFDPWLDEENILAGQDWNREITAAVRIADIVLACLSRDSINKKGFIQKEIKYALDVADEQPPGSIFIIPLRLEECEIPERLSHLQWVNLFESRGYEKLVASLRAKSGESAAGGRAGGPAVLVEGERWRAGGTILRDLLKGLLFIVLILATKLAAEQTTLGERLRSMSYDLLLPRASMPVTVVDIRDLKPADFNIDGQTGIATPREPLRQIIEAIAEDNPKAIGVFVDFSPDDKGYIHPNDPEFFRFCLDLRQRGVPVFLGVNRQATSWPAQWLGGEEYKSLAANMKIPKDRKRMLAEIKVEDPQQSSSPAEGTQPSRAMGLALADAYVRESVNSSGRLRPPLESVTERLRRVGFIEKISERSLGPGLGVTEFPIDFSQLESIEAVRTIDPSLLRYESRRFEGKVVLIGNGDRERERDLFEVPGRDRKYPGIFLHAAAAYSLINPRYEVTGKGRLVLDTLFSLTLLSFVVLLRHYYRRRGADAVASRRPRGFLTLLVVVAAIFVGVVFVRATWVMWDDFLSAPAVMIHPAIERRLATVWEELKEHASAIFGPRL